MLPTYTVDLNTSVISESIVLDLVYSEAYNIDTNTKP